MASLNLPNGDARSTHPSLRPALENPPRTLLHASAPLGQLSAEDSGPSGGVLCPLPHSWAVP